MTQRASVTARYDDEEIQRVVTMFKALSDPTRLKIITALSQGDLICVSDIAHSLKMSISRVSHHLSMLEKLGFTRHKQEGKQVFYRIDDDCIVDIMTRAKEHVSGK